tara:strand:- start:3051 stop:3815 length:765 start_codon:yes stop_codon:yes gene_type:complete
LFSIKLFNKHLKTIKLGKEITYLNQINSTNDELWNYINSGKTEGSSIIAENQTKGKGRRGNIWFSNKHDSLTFSFTIFPNTNQIQISLIPLLTGIAIANAIEKLYSTEVGLKWPNDILLEKLKLGGILTEKKTIRNDQIAIVIGIGLNINQLKNQFPNAIQKSAISLKMHLKKSIIREELMANILNEFEYLYLNSAENIVSQWENWCIHLNSKIKFNLDNEEISGYFKGINSMGEAKLDINGKFKKFSSGIVTI